MALQKVLLLLSVATLLFATGLIARRAYAAGTTVTVNVSNDERDWTPGDGQCQNVQALAANSQCSLRAAIEELNALGASSSPHRIHFDIPGPGPHIIVPRTALPLITAPILIDGTTQPGASCPTASAPANLPIVLDGRAVTQNPSGLYIFSNESAVRGLVVGNFTEVGVTLVGDNSSISCSHIGVGPDGMTPMGNGRGVFLGGTGNTLGGSAHERRNVIAANDGTGVEASGQEQQIVGNFIGTTAEGTGDLGNGDGVLIRGSAITIGGAGPLLRNVISGNNRNGIRIYGQSLNTISGNYIGVARDGQTSLPNAWNGIEIAGESSSNLIGATQSGSGNIIAHNGQNGILIKESNYALLGITIRYNSIHSNTSLGIDLGEDGVDVNDPGDLDDGENGRQNFPVLVASPGSTVLRGRLDSRSDNAYTIDLYRSNACDPTGFGEGQQHLTDIDVTTDSMGGAAFEVDLANISLTRVGSAVPSAVLSSVKSGDSITATATDPDGNTSEFSACAMLSQLPPGVTPIPEQTPTSTAPPAPEPTPEFQVRLPLVRR
jgi:parallel beta-helix repeat protein